MIHSNGLLLTRANLRWRLLTDLENSRAPELCRLEKPERHTILPLSVAELNRVVQRTMFHVQETTSRQLTLRRRTMFLAHLFRRTPRISNPMNIQRLQTLGTRIRIRNTSNSRTSCIRSRN